MEASSDRTELYERMPEWETGLVRLAQRYPTLSSTNTTLLQVGHSVEDERLALLVAADQQTAGRGRVGRSWHADSGTLTFSILDCVQRHGLKNEQIPRIAIIAGLSIAESIESFAGPIRTQLKWPNDVYIDGGKVAGILVEGVSGRPSRYVLGIGINVDTNLASAPPEIQKTARSLGVVTGRPLDRYAILPWFLERLSDNLKLAAHDFPMLIQEFRKRCLLTGHEVTWLRGNQTMRGECLGIDTDGGMRVRIAGLLETIYSGELVRIVNR